MCVQMIKFVAGVEHRDASDTIMPFQKKLVDQASLRYGRTRQPSDVGTRVLIDAVWSRNFERGEIVSPGGSIASKL